MVFWNLNINLTILYTAYVVEEDSRTRMDIERNIFMSNRVSVLMAFVTFDYKTFKNGSFEVNGRGVVNNFLCLTNFL